MWPVLESLQILLCLCSELIILSSRADHIHFNFFVLSHSRFGKKEKRKDNNNNNSNNNHYYKHVWTIFKYGSNRAKSFFFFFLSFFFFFFSSRPSWMATCAACCRGLDLISGGPFQPLQFCDSVILPYKEENKKKLRSTK